MHRLVATLAVLGALAPAKLAAAQGTAACVAAAEDGQRARRAGQLREALERFAACSEEACPRLVRGDCRQWQSELGASVPTLVFGAKDADGSDLFDVTVSSDGEVLTKHLDGRAIAVDPGPRALRFEAAGLAPVVQTVLVKEGERSRVVNVSFPGPERPGAAPEARAPSARPPLRDEPPAPRRGHTMYPWLVAGAGAVVGVVGAVVLVTSPSRPSNCSADSRTCVRGPGETDQQLQEEQSRAGNADTQPWIGLAVAGVGALAVAGGLVWHFLEPTGPPRARALQVLPAQRGYGARVVVRF